MKTKTTDSGRTQFELTTIWGIPVTVWEDPSMGHIVSFHLAGPNKLIELRWEEFAELVEALGLGGSRVLRAEAALREIRHRAEVNSHPREAAGLRLAANLLEHALEDEAKLPESPGAGVRMRRSGGSIVVQEFRRLSDGRWASADYSYANGEEMLGAWDIEEVLD